jgi:hypothetical protein
MPAYCAISDNTYDGGTFIDGPPPPYFSSNVTAPYARACAKSQIDPGNCTRCGRLIGHTPCNRTRNTVTNNTRVPAEGSQFGTALKLDDLRTALVEGSHSGRRDADDTARAGRARRAGPCEATPACGGGGGGRGSLCRPLSPQPRFEHEVAAGLGRIVSLHDCLSTSYHICEEIRYLVF